MGLSFFQQIFIFLFRNSLTSVVSYAQSMRKTTSELDNKSTNELAVLVAEMERQANIYSEMLCTELDYRDRCVLDHDIFSHLPGFPTAGGWRV